MEEYKYKLLKAIKYSWFDIYNKLNKIISDSNKYKYFLSIMFKTKDTEDFINYLYPDLCNNPNDLVYLEEEMFKNKLILNPQSFYNFPKPDQYNLFSEIKDDIEVIKIIKYINYDNRPRTYHFLPNYISFTATTTGLIFVKGDNDSYEVIGEKDKLIFHGFSNNSMILDKKRTEDFEYLDNFIYNLLGADNTMDIDYEKGDTYRRRFQILIDFIKMGAIDDNLMRNRLLGLGFLLE